MVYRRVNYRYLKLMNYSKIHVANIIIIIIIIVIVIVTVIVIVFVFVFVIVIVIIIIIIIVKFENCDIRVGLEPTMMLY